MAAVDSTELRLRAEPADDVPGPALLAVPDPFADWATCDGGIALDAVPVLTPAEGVVALDLTSPVDVRLPTADFMPFVPDAGSPAPDALAAYSSSRDPSLFNLEVDFQGSWPAELQQAFLDAVQVIETLIGADLPDVLVRNASGFAQIDDLVISATLETIDGAGGTLGRAGPVALRVPSGQPVLGSMNFDIADAQVLESTVTAISGPEAQQVTLWDATVLHEMLHVLGVGSLWGMKGLVAGDFYVGAAGALAYAQFLDPAATAGVPVPLQTAGGAGTAGVHWSEAVFGAELMTGYLDRTDTPLSRLTVASLVDLGYGLDPAGMSRVDPYMLA